MLNTEGIEAYWKKQTEAGDNPCHYHNKWQDRFAFHMRTKAFRKQDFKAAQEIVDLGCGIGEYTRYIAKLAPQAHFTGFDFTFNIAIAKKSYPQNDHITYIGAALPEIIVQEAISKADVVFTTTVYVHLSREAREAFFAAISKMRPGTKVLLLEYLPKQVPSFQKGLPYKEVETSSEVKEKFQKFGFVQKTERPVTFIDSLLFHYMGTNVFSYYLTCMLERSLFMLPAKYAKYKLMIFIKQ